MGAAVSNSEAQKRAMRKYTAKRVQQRVAVGTCRLCDRARWNYNGHIYAHCEYHHSLIQWHMARYRGNEAGVKPAITDYPISA